MKKVLVFLGMFISLASQAQDIYTDLKFTEYPVELRYPNDYKVQHAGTMSYIISDGVSEFYVKGYKLSNRFNADSLQRLFEKEIYNDADIVNLQMREKGRGSLGNLPADRLVLEFYDKEKLYKVTAFMVYFHINHEYNAFLFFFDMLAAKADPYEGLMVNMGQTLKWSDNIPYKNYNDPATGLSTELPVFWRITDVSADSLMGFSIDDDQSRFTVQMKYTADSSGADRAAVLERDAIKLKPGIYKEQKFKPGIGKTASKETYGELAGTYKEDVNGLLRPTLFKRMYYKRVVDGKLVEYIITMESPEAIVEYYAPIHQRMLAKIALPGTPYEVPKKK